MKSKQKSFPEKLINSITGNFSKKCEFCRKPVKKKDSYSKKVKRLEFVHPKKTFFCCESCHDNYVNYEKFAPRRISLCTSCPVPENA